MRVFQRGPPVVAPVEEQFGMEGDTVTVECDIKSIPRPTQVVWARLGNTIDPGKSLQTGGGRESGKDYMQGSFEKVFMFTCNS